jgi:hypothetical protein
MRSLLEHVKRCHETLEKGRVNNVQPEAALIDERTEFNAMAPPAKQHEAVDFGVKPQHDLDLRLNWQSEGLNSAELIPDLWPTWLESAQLGDASAVSMAASSINSAAFISSDMLRMPFTDDDWHASFEPTGIEARMNDSGYIDRMALTVIGDEAHQEDTASGV